MIYPTAKDIAIINEAEKIMIETMSRYDPSHDAFHGMQSSSLLRRGSPPDASHRSATRSQDRLSDCTFARPLP